MYELIFKKQAAVLKALANHRRLEIVHLLRDQSLPVTDIYTMLDLPQANVSQHLSVLRTAGVVSTTKDGKQITYRLAHEDFIEVSDLLRGILVDQTHDNDLVDSLKLKMKDLTPIVHDPVCGMRVSPKTAGYHTTFNNEEFYFCASGCLKAFQEGPEKYVKSNS